MGKLTISDLKVVAVISGIVSIAIGYHIRAASILPLIIWQKMLVVATVMCIAFAVTFYLLTMRDGLHYDLRASYRYILEGD